MNKYALLLYFTSFFGLSAAEQQKSAENGSFICCEDWATSVSCDKVSDCKGCGGSCVRISEKQKIDTVSGVPVDLTK